MNLIQDGTHAVADIVVGRMRACEKPMTLWVGGTGMVTIAPATKSWRQSQPPPDTDLVGVFTPTASARDVREALECRLGEIRA